MFAILRKNGNRWEVAAQDIPQEALDRAVLQWRARGWQITHVKLPE